jgi:predicted metal-binding membrane protein
VGALRRLALLADAGLHRLAEGSTWLVSRPGRLAGILLLGAGLFQFSPLKYSRLRQCRSPVGFVIQHWRGALMLLMFAVGGAHLGWMLALAVVMFVEKAVAWGRPVIVSVGVVLAA